MTNNLSGYTRREPFDRSRDYYVTRPFKVGGRMLTPDPERKSVDKSLFTTRLLRQMYEQRSLMIKPQEDDPVAVAAAAVPMRPVFANLPEEALADWLRQNGVTPRVGISKARLVARCDKLWSELHPEEDAEKAA